MDLGDQDEEKLRLENGVDPNVRVIPLKFFKFWPSRELHNEWRNYVFSEVVDQNILAFSVAVKIFEKVNGDCQQRQLENQLKKAKKEATASGKGSSNVKKPAATKEETKGAAQNRATGKNQSYKKYFENDDEDDDSSSDGSE